MACSIVSFVHGSGCSAKAMCQPSTCAFLDLRNGRLEVVRDLTSSMQVPRTSIIPPRRDDFDRVKRGAENDILKTPSFLLSLRQVLQLCRGGLLWGGVPCSLWIFMSAGTSCRTSSNPEGNTGLLSVRQANTMTARFVLLCIVCVARGAYFAIEQPGTSSMARFPPVRRLLLWLLSRGCCKMSRFCMAAYGSLSLKPSMVFGSAPDTQTFEAGLC
jgi:hypothetical protein